MNTMFFRCSSLTSLDLSNFNTSLVTNMLSMFENCSSLTSLNLSSQVQNMNQMLFNCVNLEYINLNNFDGSKLNSAHYMFVQVPDNIVICIKEINDGSKTISNLKNTENCYTLDCTNNWKLKRKKITEMDECVESCDNSSLYKYEYNGKCLANCEKGYLYDEDNNILNKCKCELDECLSCRNVAFEKGLCTKCNTNYYPKENDPLNLNKYIKCYKEPEGYYLDNNTYKKCNNESE